MLRERSVSKRLLTLLVKLQSEKVFKDYFLVGGTALALQMGHRKSDDIDLFTQKELKTPEITRYLKQQYGGNYQILNSQSKIFQVMIDGIKFDYYRKKYATDNIFNSKRSLGFYDDIPDESWQEIRLIGRKVPVNTVKKTILNAIQDFNNKGIGEI